MKRLPWAWFLVAVLVTVGVLLREIGLLLSRVEAAGREAFGPSVYTGFPSIDQPQNIESARSLWDESPMEVAGSLVAWHLWVDLIVLVPVLTTLLALALRRVRQVSTWKAPEVWVLPLVYCLADAAETVATVILFDCWRHPCSFPSERPFWLISVLALVKWLALLVAVSAIVVGFLRPGVNGQVSLSGSWARLRGPGRPVGSAGGLTAVVLAFALVVALPAGGPLDQIPDVIRSQFVGDRRSALTSAGLAVVLALSVLVAGLWSIRYEEDSTPVDPGPRKALKWVIGGALIVSVLLMGAQRGVDESFEWIRLLQPAAPVLTVAGLALAACAVRRWHATDDEPDSGPVSRERSAAEESDTLSPWDEPRGRAVSLLVALVVFALGLGLVRAFAPVAMTGTQEIDNAAPLLLLGVVTAACFAPVLAVLLTWALSLELPDRMKRLCAAVGVVVAVWTVIAAVVLAFNPHLAWGGATGVLATCFAFFATVTGLLGLASHRFWWRDTQTLGLGRRTPWGLVLVLCWLVASSLNFTGGYHDARVESGTVADLPTLDDRFASWREGWDESTIKECATEDGRVPLVLVAAPGGGGKAAFWTGTAMDELFGEDGPLCPQSLFAVSGVSGGAVGLAVTLGEDPGATVDARGSDPLTRLTDDGPLAQLIAAMLLRDLPQPFVGAADGWADRAEVLETAWEEATSGPTAGSGPLGTPESPRSIDQLGAGWWNGEESSHRPTVVLNSSSVTDGCRVLVSNVAQLPTDAGSCRSAVTTAGFPAGPIAVALDARAGLVDPEGAVRPQPGDECADLDVASLRASTAALMAARFPYLTPSGALRRCAETAEHRKTTNVTYGVDGGYLENTGIPALMEIWHSVAPQVELCNTRGDCAQGEGTWPDDLKIEPWVIYLENHYRSQAETAPPGRPKELWVPLKAMGASETLRSTLTLEQQAAVQMYEPLASLEEQHRFVMIAPYNAPEVQAPLGWALAETTQQSMRVDVTEAIRTYCHTTLFRSVGSCDPETGP